MTFALIVSFTPELDLSGENIISGAFHFFIMSVNYLSVLRIFFGFFFVKFFFEIECVVKLARSIFQSITMSSPKLLNSNGFTFYVGETVFEKMIGEW
jgi:hypothetical protein